MQIVEIDLPNNHLFYCPVTGQQILTEDDFIPSPAMQFCFVQNEGVFEMLSDPARSLFKLPENEIYLDYEVYDQTISTLLDNELTKNWICFRICGGGSGIGSYVVDHCIDMGFNGDLG